MNTAFVSEIRTKLKEYLTSLRDDTSRVETILVHLDDSEPEKPVIRTAHRMSPKARAEASRRMKAYWASKRRTNGRTR